MGWESLLMYRLKQTFCVACSRWKKTAYEPALKPTEKDVQDLKKKAGRTTHLDTEVDDTPSSLRVIKSLPGHVTSVGKKSKDVEADVRSPKMHASSDSGMFDCP